jgi:ABC-type transporter Mla subunit MlaD
MRTRASLGVLPELFRDLIPDSHVPLVLEQYEKAARSAFRDDADSVVDRCREAAAAALNAERALHDDTPMGKDLAELANFFSSERFGARGGRAVLSNAARIIARLHSRAKTAERLNNQTAPLSEADAECALALLGAIYRELKWARP